MGAKRVDWICFAKTVENSTTDVGRHTRPNAGDERSDCT